jgi:thioredoxin-like negative regulator of GroEL
MLFYFGDTTSAGGTTMAPIIQSLQSEYSGKVEFTVYPDIETDAAVRSFAAEKGVNRTPTTVVVSSAGRELQRWSEPATPAQLRSALDAALQSAP